MIDSGIDLDMEAVVQNVAEADIVTLYFPHLGKTLLIDARCTAHVPPLITVVPIERSSSDRLRSVRRLRPQLPRPESITMIPWARRVDSLISLGVWCEVLARVPDRAAAEACLRELRSLELAEFRDAITGCEYESLWSRSEA
jgi:hypothetical protein